MANKEHIERLKQGVDVWNVWREEHPDITINLRWARLSEADLRGADLRGADLRGAQLTTDLSRADLSGADLSGADLSRANLWAVNLCQADLNQADLQGATLRQADLRGANLSGAWLGEADLHEANLSGAHLSEADLRGTNLSQADLQGAHLRGAHLQGTNLSKANLRGTDVGSVHLQRADFGSVHLQEADLSGVSLRGKNLSRRDFSTVILRGVDFRQANLIETNLDGATLTDACLWETQRAGWSIHGIICDAVYWDKDKKERTTYGPGEFERLYADKTKVVLQFAGGILSPIEIATLPSMIEIMQEWSNCVLRLDSLQDAPGGATVTLVVEDPGQRNADQTRTLQAELKRVGQQAIELQRALLQEREGRLRVEGALNFVSNFFSPLMERVTEQAPSIQISGGTIYGNIVGDISGEKAQVHYTQNDLAALEALISEMLTHHTALPLTSAERIEFEEKLNAIREQLAAQAPNHSLLREALHTVRHMLESGVAHVLVEQWLPLLHKLG